MGCHFLLQGIFPIQWSNLGLLRLLYWQVGSLSLRHLGSPNIVSEICRNEKWGRYTIQLIFLKIFWCVPFFEIFIDFFNHIVSVLCFGFLAPRHVSSLVPRQESNPHALHRKAKSYTLGSQGSPHSTSILWSVPNISCSWQCRNTDWNHCCRDFIEIVFFSPPWFDYCFQYFLLFNLLETSLRIFQRISLYSGISTHLFYISSLICYT